LFLNSFLVSIDNKSGSKISSPVERSVSDGNSQQFCVNVSSDSSSQGSAKVSKLVASFQCLVEKLKEVYHSKSLSESKTVTELVQIAADKARMSSSTQFTELGPGKGFRCEFLLDFVLVSSGEAQNKRLAKHSAYAAAVELLRKPEIRVLDDRSGVNRYRLVAAQEPFVGRDPDAQREDSVTVNAATPLLPLETAVDQPKAPSQSAGGIYTPLANKRSAKSLQTASLKDFVVLQPSALTETNAVSILQQSADFNKWLLDYELREMGSRCRCRVTLGGHLLSDVNGETKASAKTSAAQQALKQLSSVCCTVCVKQLGDEDLDDTLKRSEVCCMLGRCCVQLVVSTL